MRFSNKPKDIKRITAIKKKISRDKNGNKKKDKKSRQLDLQF